MPSRSVFAYARPLQRACGKDVACSSHIGGCAFFAAAATPLVKSRQAQHNQQSCLTGQLKQRKDVGESIEAHCRGAPSILVDDAGLGQHPKLQNHTGKEKRHHDGRKYKENILVLWYCPMKYDHQQPGKQSKPRQNTNCGA